MHMPLSADLEKYPGQDRSTLISAFTDTPRYKYQSGHQTEALPRLASTANDQLMKSNPFRLWNHESWFQVQIQMTMLIRDNDSGHKESMIVVLSGYALGHL